MRPRIIWTSWSKELADIEISKFKNLSMEHEWLSAHIVSPIPTDVYLTGDGYNHKDGKFKKCTMYVESFMFMRDAYTNFNIDNRWGHRFHYNPYYYTQSGCSRLKLAGWWKEEISLFDRLRKYKKINHVFGMVLGKKPDEPDPSLGWLRTQIVEQLRDRSFKYYGGAWPADKNYGGEAYINGNRSSSYLKFHDARMLMSNCKFVFAIENIYDKRESLCYLTEKIFHAFLSRSVPIYMGCYNPEDLISPSLFIDMRKFGIARNKPQAIKKLADYCENMPDTEYNDYISKIDGFMQGMAIEFTRENRFKTIDSKIKELFG